MAESHVELIAPSEKISPELGGTGYLPPVVPAYARQLAADAISSAEAWPELNSAVWKVWRQSVRWDKPARTRRLKIGTRKVPCEIIGSSRDWWFVVVNARQAAAILGNGSP